MRLADLRPYARSHFGVSRRDFEEGDDCCVRQAPTLKLSKGGRPRKGDAARVKNPVPET